MTQHTQPITAESIFYKIFEPQPMIVEGLISKGLTVLGGSPKIGKSWLALDLAISVANGVPFLGKSVQKTGVLYYCLEDTYQHHPTSRKVLTLDRNIQFHLPLFQPRYTFLIRADLCTHRLTTSDLIKSIITRIPIFGNVMDRITEVTMKAGASKKKGMAPRLPYTPLSDSMEANSFIFLYSFLALG